MATIGRPDIASAFLMDRIRAVRSMHHTTNSHTPRDALIRRETLYLFWLAPFIRDYYYSISFRISPESGWIRRRTTGYNELFDFLDNFNYELNRLVGPGEVVISDGSYVPYSALDPEEDLATAGAVYGIIHTTEPSMALPPDAYSGTQRNCCWF